jgi:hypothetical protein
LVLADSQAVLRPSHSTPDTVVTPIPTPLQAAAGDYQPETAGSVDLVAAPTHTDYTVPRYVLDRITPASYEVSSLHF